MPGLRPAVHPRRPAPLVLRCLPPGRMAATSPRTRPGRRPPRPAAGPGRHHLPVPRMRPALPRPAAVRVLQDVLPPRRARRAMPALRRASRCQRPHNHQLTKPGGSIFRCRKWVNFRMPLTRVAASSGVVVTYCQGGRFGGRRCLSQVRRSAPVLGQRHAQRAALDPLIQADSATQYLCRRRPSTPPEPGAC